MTLITPNPKTRPLDPTPHATLLLHPKLTPPNPKPETATPLPQNPHPYLPLEPFPPRPVQDLFHTYLAEYIYQFVLESQLLHKIVDLLLTFTDKSIELTILWGESSFQNQLIDTLCQISKDRVLDGPASGEKGSTGRLGRGRQIITLTPTQDRQTVRAF